MSIAIHEPHLNAELYRTHDVTKKEHKNLEFIDICNDGNVLVGGSDLQGRYWDGAIKIGKPVEDFLTPQYEPSSILRMKTDSGVTDGRFLKNSSNVVICEDSGELRIWQKSSTWSSVTNSGADQQSWMVTATAWEHDEAVIAIDLFPSSDNAVTGGADNCIKIWDLLNIISVETYQSAHGNIVSDVACNKTLQNTFLSSSLDGSVTLWNYKDPDKILSFGSFPCAARCVTWLSENLFAVGYDDGDITLFNTSNNTQSVHTVKTNNPIHRMVYNNEHKMLAVCGDSNRLSVYKRDDGDILQLIYEDWRHSDYIRGLSWDITNSSTLYTCGWDGNFFQHSILV